MRPNTQKDMFEVLEEKTIFYPNIKIILVLLLSRTPLDRYKILL